MLTPIHLAGLPVVAAGPHLSFLVPRRALGRLAGLRAAGSTPSITLHLGSGRTKPSEAILIVLALTVLAVVPSLLILLTSFTQIVIVLGLTRQALGLSNVPPNQVLAGLALFLSLFVMAPTISAINHQAVQPYISGRIDAIQAYDRAEVPLRTWMLRQTRPADLTMLEQATHQHPTTPAKATMAAVIPAFLLSELRNAFIIGFVIFIPFVVIDLVVSAALASLGMMMLPPTLISLPFKLLLFVLVDGWTLVVHTLLVSYR